MMVHFTLFRTSDGSLVVLPTELFDKAVAEGQLTDAEADPICQGDIEEVFMAFDALSKETAHRGTHDDK